LNSSSDFDLPDDCWERVVRFLNDEGDDHRHRYLKSLSVVSKLFLSLTNHHKFSLTILYPTLPVLPRLLQRFTKLTSLNLSSYYGDLDALLIQISRFPLKLTLLNLSNQLTVPANGLRAFSQNITTLTSLICTCLYSINSTDLNLIADCFPLLEELDLGNPYKFINHIHSNFPTGLEALLSALFKLRKLNLSHHYYLNDFLIFHLFKNCKFLEEVILPRCQRVTNKGVACALRERPTLRSLSFSGIITSRFIDSLLSLKGLTALHCSRMHISNQFLISIAMESLPLTKLVLKECTGFAYSGISYLLSKSQRIQHLDLQNTEFLSNYCVVELSLFLGNLVSINLSYCLRLTDSALFALVRNCPLLTDISMESTKIGSNIQNPDSLMDPVVKPQVKYLRLARTFPLPNEKIIMFAAIFPNLQLLDLRDCVDITEEGIGQVLWSCRKIRHLNLTFLRLKSLGMSFDLPNLEVLNLTETKVDDEALYVISNRCPSLLQLELQRCADITKKGVMHVVKNCTQLREINLNSCPNVHAKVVASMVRLRPSLRKIEAPPGFRLTDRNRKLLSSHGCFLNPKCLG